VPWEGPYHQRRPYTFCSCGKAPDKTAPPISQSPSQTSSKSPSTYMSPASAPWEQYSPKTSPTAANQGPKDPSITDTMMSRNKPRLYLALYARPKFPGTYHYALLVSPKIESLNPEERDSTKYHCKNILQAAHGVVSTPWTVEREHVNANADFRILVRVLLGKVPSTTAFDMYIDDVHWAPDQPGFSCVEWVRLALDQLRRSGIANVPHWEKVERTALQFVELKKKEGRFEVGWHGDASKVPTYDMLLKEETVP
jgi:hypothetical protein